MGESLAWLGAALIFDGSIGVLKSGSPDYFCYNLRVELSCIEEDVIRHMLDCYGGRMDSYEPRGFGRRTVYRWLHSNKSAFDLLRKAYPYLVGKKKEIARLVLAYYPVNSPYVHRGQKKVMIRRKRLHDLIIAINRR